MQTDIIIIINIEENGQLFSDMFRQAYAIFSLIVNNKYVIQLLDSIIQPSNKGPGVHWSYSQEILNYK